MKTNFFIAPLLLGLVMMSACQKSSDVTLEINKVETSYTEVGEKDESKIVDNSPTTIASKEFVEQYIAEVTKNNDLIQVKNELKAANTSVAVIAGRSTGLPCGMWPMFNIYMDGNDGSNNFAGYSGWTGGFTLSGGNALMRFCLVPSDVFNFVAGKNFAVLRVSATGNPKAQTIKRYFDNEDKRDASWVQFSSLPPARPYNMNGVTTTNMSGVGNLDMYLDYYPSSGATTYGSFPDFGISYGVFGSLYSTTDRQGWFQTCEEQTNNANWFKLNGQPTTTTAGTPGVDGIMYGYTGTIMQLAKVY